MLFLAILIFYIGRLLKEILVYTMSVCMHCNLDLLFFLPMGSAEIIVKYLPE